jgi:hypothetical protein
VIDIYVRTSRAVDVSTIKVELGTESVEERGAHVGEVFTDPSMSAWNPEGDPHEVGHAHGAAGD